MCSPQTATSVVGTAATATAFAAEPATRGALASQPIPFGVNSTRHEQLGCAADQAFLFSEREEGNAKRRLRCRIARRHSNPAQIQQIAMIRVAPISRFVLIGSASTCSRVHVPPQVGMTSTASFSSLRASSLNCCSLCIAWNTDAASYSAAEPERRIFSVTGYATPGLASIKLPKAAHRSATHGPSYRIAAASANNVTSIYSTRMFKSHLIPSISQQQCPTQHGTPKHKDHRSLTHLQAEKLWPEA